ncbi:MAG TPA: T9SS type A sorting domain-containing protein [Chitinophagales bacterium]|nr:T9SS type A sorting domain-containing protein [Chitinophagales bacterium]HNO30092.1 T9SS type A sorting domain-containing protein [Chitinophagales bacterium]
MKHCLVAIFVVLAGVVSAQTTAENWTQTDCDGVDHDLYATLDTGAAVVMEFVMLESCMPCINAAHMMAPIIDRYDLLYNNRVQYYTFGYNDTYLCDDFATWESDNAIANDAALLLGADISSYYGGMGMPTIVVVGRNTHQVYFNQFGFVIGDTTDFSNAIAYALGIADPETGVECMDDEQLLISPNPAFNSIQINGILEPNATLRIINLQGQICMDGINPTENPIDIQMLKPGMYLLECKTDTGISIAKFTVQ